MVLIPVMGRQIIVGVISKFLNDEVVTKPTALPKRVHINVVIRDALTLRILGSKPASLNICCTRSLKPWEILKGTFLN